MERKKKKSVNRFPRVRCKVDVILGHCVGAQGCIAVELWIPDRKHGMIKSEFGGRGFGGGGERRGDDGLTQHTGC